MKELRFYINALYLSLFSRKFYAGLIGGKQFLGVKYLLILALLLAVPLSLNTKYLMSKMFPSGSGISVEENLDYIQKQLPPIFYNNGKFKIAAPANQNIVSRSGDLVIVVDVEDKIDDLDDYNHIVVISPDAFRLRLPDNSGIKVIMANELYERLRQYFGESITGEKKLDIPRIFHDLSLLSMIIITVPLLMLAFFLEYSLFALFFSFLAGMMFASMCKRTRFDFRQCFRVAAFTATPVALLEIIAGGLFSYASLVYFITHLVYIHFAIESYKKIELNA